MPSHYAHGLELLARLQHQINDIKPDTMDRRTAVQRWHGLGPDWKLLSMALIATGEAADNAVGVSNQQRTRYRTHVNRYLRSGELRIRQADTCLDHFRHVTALSRHARAVTQHHESDLRSWGNLQAHYLEALGPQTHTVPLHQTFLDNLSRDIEAMKRNQGLEMVCLRWVQLRAAADLAAHAKRFHLACRRIEVRRRIADGTCREAKRLREEVARRMGEYEHLETEVWHMRRAIQIRGDLLFGPGGGDMVFGWGGGRHGCE